MYVPVRALNFRFDTRALTWVVPPLFRDSGWCEVAGVTAPSARRCEVKGPDGRPSIPFATRLSVCFTSTAAETANL